MKTRNNRVPGPPLVGVGLGLLLWIGLWPSVAGAAPGDYRIVKSFPAPQVSPDGLEWDGEHLWSTECQSDVNFKLDPQTGAQVAQTRVPGVMFDHFAWDGAAMWGTEAHTTKVHRLDSAMSKSVETFEAPTEVMGIAWDGAALWLLDPKARQIYRWNHQQRKPETTFKTPGDNPCGLGWDGKCLWASDLTTQKFYQIDPATGKVVLTIDAPGGPKRLPTGFTWDGQHVWVADEDPANPTIYALEIEFLQDGPCGRPSAPDAGVGQADAAATNTNAGSSGCRIGDGGSAGLALWLVAGCLLAVRRRRHFLAGGAGTRFEVMK